jgi:ATP-binding cassette subfamily C protein
VARLTSGAAAGLFASTVLLVGQGVLHLAAPVLITLIVLLSRITTPAVQVQQAVLQIANVLPAYFEIRALRGELTAASRADDGKLALDRSRTADVSFHDVSFRHANVDAASGESRPAVVGLTFDLPAGTFLGVTGASGAGKTTIADLLAGLIRPQSGSILVDGISLRDASIRSWRERIAYVPQDSYLFHASVRDNLLRSAPQASDTQLWESLEIAGARPLIENMSAGLETIVGERGILISGGERQRLALARAFLRRPDLLILDEATSAIDIASEQTILERLRAALPSATIVLIAHRNESLRGCDRIAVMDGGRFSFLHSRAV